MESALRPRDIQARIRAGETPEAVAVAAQTSVDSIMAFATPVLAERAHVAQTAQKASVRRRSDAASTARTLGESAGLFFADHSLHDEDVTWDAWRQADGRWALVATYTAGGRDRRAEFTHDLPGRYVVAENDDARLLTGELRDGGSAAAPQQTRRLSAVPDDDELPLGDDAIELVRDRVEEPAPAENEADDEVDDEVTVELDRELTEDAEQPELPGTSPAGTDQIGESVDAEESELKRASARPKRKGRSSIPSWDEIMFGDGKGDGSLRPWPTSSPARRVSSGDTWSRSCSTNRQGEVFVLVPRGLAAPHRGPDRALGRRVCRPRAGHPGRR